MLTLKSELHINTIFENFINLISWIYDFHVALPRNVKQKKKNK